MERSGGRADRVDMGVKMEDAGGKRMVEEAEMGVEVQK